MRRGVKTYNKWKEVGLLEGVGEEDEFKLAHYFEEAYELVKNLDDSSVTILFPIIRRLFIINNDLNIEEIYETLNKYYQTTQYKGLKAELRLTSYQYARAQSDIDVEADLIAHICENYEEIKNYEKG